MKQIVFSKDIKISFALALIGLFSGISAVLWQLSDSSLSKMIPITISKEALIVISAFQVMIMAFILSIIGIKLSKKVGLKLYSEFNIKNTLHMIIVSGIICFIMIATDKFVFDRYLGEYAGAKFHFNFMELVASVLYGGFVEEVMMRLFLVSLLVFILKKVFTRRDSALDIPDWIYNTAIFIAAMAFAVGHLPATITVLGLSTPIIIRCFLLNGLGGLIFGYFYWKKGFAMAIASHITVHLFRIFIFMPLFF